MEPCDPLCKSQIEKPFAGLKIVVTRPRCQAEYLAQRIEQAGGIPLLFPLLEITAVADNCELNEQISRLAQFDLAIFISPNAVNYGIAAIRAQGATLPAPTPSLPRKATLTQSLSRGERVRLPFPPLGERWIEGRGKMPRYANSTLMIATVGQGSANALRELGIADVIAPTGRFDSEGLLGLPELQNVAGWRVMIFRGDGGRELLGDTLRARGAAVEYAACYRRSKPQQEIAVLLDAAPDALTVTSSEALNYLWQMLNDAQRGSLCELPLFVPHMRIAELARRLGWRQVLLTDTGDDGLLSALKAWAGKRIAD